MKLTLRPYKPADAAIITSWIKDEYSMRQWCADRYNSYPVTPEEMNCFHSRFMNGKTSRAMTMCDGDEVVGYITLRIPAKDKAEQRLGFVIIDNSQQGRGLGKALVRMTTKFAFEKLGTSKVSLGVFENNSAAIHCYEAECFRRVPIAETESYVCLGEIWKCVKMERNGS